MAEEETCVAEVLADEVWDEAWDDAEEVTEAMEDATDEEAAEEAAAVELDPEPPVTRLQISVVICCVAEDILVS